MSMLRILTGYVREDYSDEVPEILYVGYDADAAHRIAYQAPAQFVRVELLDTRRGRRLRKGAPSVAVQNSTPHMPAPGAGETHDNPAPGALPADAAESGPEPEGGEAGDGDAADDGPSLSLPKGRKPR